MYENVGGKIKVCAVVTGWVICLVGILTGLALLKISVIFTLLCFIGGALGLFGSWPLYGFGQLIEDVSALRSRREAPQVEQNQSTTDELPEL